MKLRARFWVGLSLLFAAVSGSAIAMSVNPPTFPELVAEASAVAHARVIRVASGAVAGPDGQRVIKTFVTFATVKAIKGQVAAEFTLSFLGGTAEGETWRVSGMPEFAVGDEEFLFTTMGETICPLVGAMHGRYRILNDNTSRRRYVARDNLEPLTATADVVAPIEASSGKRTATATSSAALTPDQFEQAISSELTRPTKSPAQR